MSTASVTVIYKVTFLLDVILLLTSPGATSAFRASELTKKRTPRPTKIAMTITTAKITRQPN